MLMDLESVLRVENEGIKLIEDINMFKHHPSASTTSNYEDRYLMKHQLNESDCCYFEPKRDAQTSYQLQSKMRQFAKSEAKALVEQEFQRRQTEIT